jgi:hypothetical protein
MLLTKRAPERDLRLIDAYTQALSKVYRAIAEITQGAIIVDSTKDPPYVLAIRQLPIVRLRVVHLVRDSRGVVFSWQKKVDRPELSGIPGKEHLSLGGIPLLKSAPEWMLRNLLFHSIRSMSTPCLFVQYESLLAKPSFEISRILAFAGNSNPSAQIEGLTDTKYESKLQHTVGGNRIRFLRGPVQLRLDESWKRDMRRRDRFLVTLITFPLLVKYGYVGLFHHEGQRNWRR